VSYFRSQHNNESWVAALAAILDTSALLIASVDRASSRQARLTFAMCRHTVVDLAQVFDAAPRSASSDRLPPSELDRLRTVLAAAGFELQDSPTTNQAFAELRHMYEPYLEALGQHLFMQLPPWVLAKEISDNWRTSAWGRISGFGSSDPRQSPPDDHTD
jgi:hypothetical protein